MKSKFTLFIAFLLVSTIAMSQSVSRCATMEYHEMMVNEGLIAPDHLNQLNQSIQQWIDNNQEQKTSAFITIPVVFHVIYNTNAQNISDARIFKQLEVLNKDYSRTNADASNTPSAFSSIVADTEIQFCLATKDPAGNATTGITRTFTTTQYFSYGGQSAPQPMKYTAQGGHDVWNRNHYLNIWVVNFGSTFTLGYAQFPGGPAATDGVVVDYRTVGGPGTPGTMNPYHLGRTATHEVGHWLGLYHIWGDDGTSCSGSDLVADTPNQAGENYGCPPFPKVTCSNGPNGDMHMNYMDYTDDACMNSFTQGQKTRMQGAINTQRNFLAFSQGCMPVGITSPNALEMSINVYPNPSSGDIIISTTFQEDTDMNISVYNVLGEPIFKEEKKNLLRNKIDIDLNKVSNGIYYVVFESDGLTASRKVNILR